MRQQKATIEIEWGRHDTICHDQQHWKESKQQKDITWFHNPTIAYMHLKTQRWCTLSNK